MIQGSQFNRQRQFDLKQENLLRVAADCFNQKGFSGTSLKDVARQLDITDAAIYYYVKNKEELVYKCYVRAVTLAKEALDKALEVEGTAADKLRAYIVNQVHVLCDDDIGPVAVLSEIQGLKEHHRDQLLEYTRDHSQRLSKLLKEGMANGSIKQCNQRLAVSLVMGATNWIPKWYRHNSTGNPEEIAEFFSDTILGGLLPK